MAADPNANDFAGYRQFRCIDGTTFGSFEVFYATAPDGFDETGWYWWACSPGCLPDGEAAGPFDTSEEAFHDAQDF